jgi:hypothetical protein
MGRTSTVSLQIAAEHGQVRLARLVAAGIAAMQGLDLEAVEDLRIAVDEGCVWLIEQGSGGALALAFDVREDGTIAVTGETSHDGELAGGALGDLAAQILAASCAEHRFERDASHARFSLVARAVTSPDGAPAHEDEGES